MVQKHCPSTNKAPSLEILGWAGRLRNHPPFPPSHRRQIVGLLLLRLAKDKHLPRWPLVCSMSAPCALRCTLQCTALHCTAAACPVCALQM